MGPWIKCVLKGGQWQGNGFEEKVGLGKSWGSKRKQSSKDKMGLRRGCGLKKGCCPG
jgi:hypothetical protein